MKKKKKENMEVIKNNRAKDLPIYQGICASGFDMC